MRFKVILGAQMPDNFRSKRSYFTSEIADSMYALLDGLYERYFSIEKPLKASFI